MCKTTFVIDPQADKHKNKTSKTTFSNKKVENSLVFADVSALIKALFMCTS